MSAEIVLELDLKWREAELASLKRQAIISAKDSVAYRSLLRAMWALLCAHFEGFTKFCWDTVLDNIQAENIPASELDIKFALPALEPEFKICRTNHDSRSILTFFGNNLPVALKRSAAFPDESRWKAESNLWPNILERESDRIGIQCSELQRNRPRIKTLVARRNELAHGKSMIIADLDEYHEYENATLCLMHELALKSIETIDSHSYRRNFVSP